MSGNERERGFEPEILVLFCQHAVDPSVTLANAFRRLSGLRVRLVVVPCSSSVEVRQLIKILEQGADGIQVIGCPEGACRFLVGSTRAERRVAYVRKLLEEIDFGPERIGIHRGKGISLSGLLELARYRAELIRSLGPNPMRQDQRIPPPEGPVNRQ